MTIEKLISITSMIIWLIPPVRNLGTRYFFYFFILAIEDPLVVFVLSKFHLVHNLLMPFFTLLLLYSLSSKKYGKILVAVSIIFLALILFSDLSNQTTMLLNAFLHVFILGIFISDFLSYFDTNHSINFFLLLLISYEFIGIAKNILLLLDLAKGIVIFYTGAFYQIFLGITFIIWNVNNSPRYKIKWMDT